MCVCEDSLGARLSMRDLFSPSHEFSSLSNLATITREKRGTSIHVRARTGGGASVSGSDGLGCACACIRLSSLRAYVSSPQSGTRNSYLSAARICSHVLCAFMRVLLILIIHLLRSFTYLRAVPVPSSTRMMKPVSMSQLHLQRRPFRSSSFPHSSTHTRFACSA